jgi:NADH dehydrogenase
MILVTGGTGVVGNAAVAELLRRGHFVRLLTRHADADAAVWPEGVQAHAGDVTDAESIRGAAEGCHAVVHIAGTVRDQPEAPLHQVNVIGTRHVVDEAARDGVGRFVFVSSLGTERGNSEYHRSKRDAEEIVRGFPGPWVVLRPGMVYGPGDEVVSVLIRMIRSLPLVPVVGRSHPFQPIWHEDLANAIAATLERDDLVGQTLELAGAETTTIDDVLDRIEALTDRAPARVPLPSFLAKLGASLSERFDVGAWLGGLTRFDTPIDRSKLTMLEEDNVLPDPGQNPLLDVFRIEPTSLVEGLRRMVRELPEQLPDQGEGALERKRFSALVQGSSLSAPELMRVFRVEARALLPIEFGPDEEPDLPLEPGMTLTLELPVRGQVQVRVEEATDDHVTFATVEGHPLAGIVRFIARPEEEGGLRFSVEVFSRSANVLDWIMMKSGGAALQRSVWRQAVERVVERTGGDAPDGVREEHTRLEGDEAAAVEAWIAGMVEARKREENARATGQSVGWSGAGAEVSPPESAT